MEIILNIVWAAVIFGALATGPIIAWLVAVWLVTDRRRSSPSARTS